MHTVLNAKQVAHEYFDGSVSYWKLLAMAKEGKIPHFKIGSRIFFRRESLDEWIAALETSAKPPVPKSGIMRLVAP